MRDRDRVVGVQALGTQPHAPVGGIGEQFGFAVGEVVVVREHEDRILGRLDLDDRIAVLVELDDGPLDRLQQRLEAASGQRDAGRGLDRNVTDRLLALVEGVADERGRRALVGVESSEVRPLERDGELVAQDEVGADVLPNRVREEKGGVDTPAEHVEAAGTARDVVEREVGLRGDVVPEHDELAHATDSDAGGHSGVGSVAATAQ